MSGCWIPVAERLPDDDCDVLACRTGDHYDWMAVCHVVTREVGPVWYLSDGGQGVLHVTHWRDLPEPPAKAANGGRFARRAD